MTPSPIPATDISVLIKRVNALGQQCPYDMLEMRRCEIEAKRLLDIQEFSAASASVLGMLAAIRDDLQDLVKWHELAIQISGGSYLSFDHYATSLFCVFEYERALEIAEIGFEKSGYRRSLDTMIRSADALGDDDLALKYIMEWRRRFGEDYPELTIFDEDDFVEVLEDKEKAITGKEHFLREQDFDMEMMRRLAEEIRSSQ